MGWLTYALKKIEFDIYLKYFEIFRVLENIWDLRTYPKQSSVFNKSDLT